MMVLASLAGCHWFGARKSRAPDPSEIVVTGAPAGSLIYIDGTQVGQPAAHEDQTQVLDVTAGTHKVEVQSNDRVVYREDTYVGPGEQRFVTVLSGKSR